MGSLGLTLCCIATVSTSMFEREMCSLSACEYREPLYRDGSGSTSSEETWASDVGWEHRTVSSDGRGGRTGQSSVIVS